MPTDPITAHRKVCFGVDRNKLAKKQNYNRIAAKVEKHINSHMVKQLKGGIYTFYSDLIALKIREDNDIVHEIIFATGGGHTAIRIIKRDVECAMAARG